MPSGIASNVLTMCKETALSPNNNKPGDNSKKSKFGHAWGVSGTISSITCTPDEEFLFLKRSSMYARISVCHHSMKHLVIETLSSNNKLMCTWKQLFFVLYWPPRDNSWQKHGKIKSWRTTFMSNWLKARHLVSGIVLVLGRTARHLVRCSVVKEQSQVYLLCPNTESYWESVLRKTESGKILILFFLPALRYIEEADLTCGLHHSKPFFIHNDFNIIEFVLFFGLRPSTKSTAINFIMLWEQTHEIPCWKISWRFAEDLQALSWS